MPGYRTVQEPWGGWYTVTPDGRWIGPFPSEDQAKNVVEGTLGTPERPATGKPIGYPGTSMPGLEPMQLSTQASMPGASTASNMDSNNYVAPDGNGGWIVVVNGQPIPGSPFPSQNEAENAYNAANGPASTPTTPTAGPVIPTAPTIDNPFALPTTYTASPPDKSARSQVIAWIWNNSPDIRNNYARGGWNVQSWDGVVAAIQNWLEYPANAKYSGDPFAAAMDMGIDDSQAWTKDSDGNYILTSVDDLKSNYGTEKPWEREAPDMSRYWVNEGLVTDPAGKQRYQWKNAITGEYRWTDEDKNPSAIIPTTEGAAGAQTSWNFTDVLSKIGLDANALNWNVSPEYMPSEAAKTMFRDARMIPASLDILTGGARDESMNRTVAAGYLQGSKFVNDMMGEANQRGIGAQRGNSGFEFVEGKHLPARQVMNALHKEGEEGTTAKTLSGLAEYSGQNASDFWTDFQSHLPQGQGNPLTRYI